MCEPPQQQHSIPSADCRTATWAVETGRAPLETSGTCGEPVGSFRSDLSVDAVCTQRACAGWQTEGGGAGASFRARATLGRRAFSGRLNVACVGPRVQRVVDAFGKLVNSPLANTFPDRYLHRSVERLRSLFEALLFSCSRGRACGHPPFRVHAVTSYIISLLDSRNIIRTIR
jgi:hypothetical protein